MQAGRAVGGAGAARHEGDAGPAGELADGLGHHHGPTLLAADRHGDVAVMERVERGQIAFTGHTENMAHAVDDELVDQHLAARAHIVLAAHFPLLVNGRDTRAFRHKAESTRRTNPLAQIGLPPGGCDKKHVNYRLP